MNPIVLPVTAVAIILAAEAPTWRGYRRRVRASAADGGTARCLTLVGLSSAGAALAVSGWANQVSWLAASGGVLFAGLGVTALGAGLRFWAIQALGSSFTLTLQVPPAQSLVQAGPYRYIRHPSYLGGEMALFGLGLTFGNALSAALMSLPMLAAHLWRMSLEERMMAAALGPAWQQYARKTARMIPGIF